MRVFAFQGLRYAKPYPEIDPLAAPAYDQIDDPLRDRLQAKSPHQFAHLTVPLSGLAGDPYQESTRLHANWLASGVVRRDDEPSLYPYVIGTEPGSQRFGLCAMVGIEDPASGVIRPHEATLDKPLADRLALLDANRVDLEPVFFLCEDGGKLDALIEEDIYEAAPTAMHNDMQGNHHELFRVSNPERLRLYQDLLADLPGAIADGHHRYKTARRFADQIGAQPGSAAAAKLTVISSLSSPGLTIDPIHRAFKTELDLGKLERFAVSRRAVRPQDGPSFAAQVAAAPQPAIGFWAGGDEAEIWQLDSSQAPDSLPASARDLTVSLLQGALLPVLGYAPESATDGTVVYRSDPAQLAEQVQEGSLKIGVYLPPMTPASFAAAIAQGDLLPPKATRFLPKVVSGLVWADHESTLA